MATRGRVTSQEGASTSRREPAPPLQIPPFLVKTYDMIDDPSTNHMVAWSPSGQSFIVWDPMDFARDQLPQHFKHNNYSSFVRQLNTYGFRKVDPDQSEFANEFFIRGRKDLLREIHRRKATGPTQSQGQNAAQLSPISGPAAVEVGQYGGVTDEILGLKRDKNILMLELLRQRQQQKASDLEMRKLGQRLEETDNRQRQMMTFLAKAVQNPSFLQQILATRQQNLQRIDSSDMKGRKKRRTPASKDVLGSPDILGPEITGADILGADTDSAEEDHADDQAASNHALVQYMPPQEPDFSKQFLQMLARDAPTAGPFDPEQQSDWQRHGMGDMGAAFDGLNISHRPHAPAAMQPSVTIREHLPTSSPAGSGDNSAYLPSTDSFGADLDLMDGQPAGPPADRAQLTAATSLQQRQNRQKQKPRSPRHYRAPQAGASARSAAGSGQPAIKPDPEMPYLPGGSAGEQGRPGSTQLVLSNGGASPLHMGFPSPPHSMPSPMNGLDSSLEDMAMLPDVGLEAEPLNGQGTQPSGLPQQAGLMQPSGAQTAYASQQPAGAEAIKQSYAGPSNLGGSQSVLVQQPQPQQQQPPEVTKRTSSLDAIRQLQEQLTRQSGSRSLPKSFT
ncbi:hypothetical protein WJX84_001778 [Apatococcus fuscideae]|uniref:HSF-type DNA-binding domain-containing protein n=1 Tax=Apatococcus fuscideae TaxID=2026836 RepID=A0AAW1TCZ3_9CHLO